MRKHMFLCMLTVLLCMGITAAHADAKWNNKHTEAYFGTVSVLRIYTDTAQAEQIWSDIKQMLSDVESSVSVSVPESDVSRFNHLSCGESIAVNDITADLLTQAKALHQLTDELYDPSVYPLIDLWGFSPRFNTRKYEPAMPYDRPMKDGILPMPEAAWINNLLPLVNFDGVILQQTDDSWILTKQTPAVVIDGYTYEAQIDLGGIAKGYACDLARQIMQQYGCENGYFSCGGSSITVLKNAAAEDGKYELTLQKPREGASQEKHYGSLRVSDCSLSTSNDISHGRTYNGVLYCHIVDPRTGWPVNTSPEGQQPGVISVTMFSPRADICDGATTALMLMGQERAALWLEAHPEYQAVLVCDGEETYQVCEKSEHGLEVNYCDEAYVLME